MMKFGSSNNKEENKLEKYISNNYNEILSSYRELEELSLIDSESITK